MISLRCPAQNYAWGRPAEKSEVAKLAGLNGSTIDESKPFAELWMGTHPSGPAVISGQDSTLKEWIEAHPEALGEAVLKRFGTDLPYLFKVLSVQTALSIQSHPDKKLAEKLHAQQPQDYKDDNHKPEMALALEDFEALCGFVSNAELKQQLQQQPELRLCVGEEAASAFLEAEEEQAKPALKAAFTALMTCDAEKVAGAIDTLVQRLNQEAAGRALSEKEALVLRLNQQYPNDVGVLSAFFLNQVRLAPGEAIYLAANEPHAYVSGELVECMAASDNVIRAGLTPKFRDTAVLCESLTYNTGVPEVLKGQPVHDHVKAYRPPFDEFEIQHIEAPAGESVTVPTNHGPLLLLVHAGAGSATAAEGSSSVKDAALQQQAELHRGTIVFVPAGTALTFDASAAGPLKIWVAAVNAKVFAVPVEVPAVVPAEVVEAAKEPVLVA
ncbi:hypothetical protein OEZ86_011420 [Tetradesmus obliquus]|nr:hypothetical protein OEZ86_011420 [Tetradesmus obliquus]